MNRKFLKINSTPEWRCLFQLFGGGRGPSSPARPPTSYAALDLPRLRNRPSRAKTCQCASHSSFAQLCFMLLFDACLSSLGGPLSLWSTSTDQRSPHDNEANTTKLCHESSHTHSRNSRSIFSPRFKVFCFLSLTCLSCLPLVKALSLFVLRFIHL